MKTRVGLVVVIWAALFSALSFWALGLSMAGDSNSGLGPPVVGQSTHHDLSPPLGSIPPIPPPPPGDGTSRPIPLGRRPLVLAPADGAARLDPVVQDRFGPLVMPSPIVNFAGVGNVDYVLPPDTNGDVGPNHYVQWVNLSFQIWNKSGTSVYGPASGNTLWAGFGGPCETTNDGDPVALYDSIDSRWLMSQFALPNFPNGPFYQCIAVSQTSDPTGSWYRYAFPVHSTKLNDYPKFGVWPDGYYMSVNQFSEGSLGWAGAGAVVFERSKMLTGATASFQYFDLASVNSSYGGMLPSDLDGAVMPPAGSPNYFLEMDDDAYGWATDRLSLWRFHVDWTTPANSTFGIGGNPNAVLNTASFDSSLSNIPQPGTSATLDTLSDRLMFRLQYRNFGAYEALVTNHSVDANGSDRGGVRWYEVRDPGGSPSIYQQGTYSPDAVNRWMGSIAMDTQGNMALGYSVSSSSVYPGIRYAGRLAADPLGTLPQGEQTLIAGGGSQQSGWERWGDYSAMTVDPVDDCTFWYTTEYYSSTSDSSWKTRIGSFRFPTCQQVPGCYVLSKSASPSGGGTIGAVPAPDCPGYSWLYSEGTVVTLTANANPGGYVFDHWGGDASGSANPTTVAMTGNKSAVAHFTGGPEPPANDECSSATVIPSLPYTTTLNTTLASENGSDPTLSCQYASPREGYNTVWYTFTPSVGGYLTADTAGSSYDTILAVHTGSCSSPSEQACSDDYNSTPQSRVQVPVAAGVPQYIEIASGTAGGGTLALSASMGSTCPGVLSNGSFETGGTFPTGWKASGKLTAQDKRDSSSGACNGSWAFKMLGDRNTKKLSQVVYPSGGAGQSLTLGLCGKATSQVPSNAKIRAQVIVYHTDGTKEKYTVNVPRGTSWQTYQWALGTTKGSYNKMKIVLSFVGTAGSVWWDNVSLCAGG